MKGDHQQDPVADLLETLRRVEQRAERTLRGLAEGSVPRGTSALGAIRNEAKDARARALASNQREAAPESAS